MDNRKKEMQLQMARGKGWTTKSLPVRPETPPITRMPVPMPMPELPVVEEPGKECGYCLTLGMAYVPMQEFTDVYEAEEGFARGTIFAELDLPFMGKGDCRRG